MNLTQEQEKLAREIAYAIDDMHSMKMHRDFVVKYAEVYLREQMKKALAYKDKDILVSRGAIYKSLVENNAAHFRN